MFGVGIVETAAGLPQGALVAMGRKAAHVFQHSSHVHHTEADFATFLDQLLASASPRVSWRMVCDRLQSSSDVVLT